MGTVNHEGAIRMYSWWWNSHICPKNSKWLLENLADMDDKVKQMIKLIEEDADSFARRAEMFYKKRPELMKLVEEFYRAYRALAERYDHATGVIRQAHKTMAEAFPNQVPRIPEDDMPADSALEFDTHKNDMTSRSCSSTCTDVLPKDSATQALPQRNLFSPGGGRELNSLTFHDTGESEERVHDNIRLIDDSETQVLSELELMIKNEMHIQNLRKAVCMLEDEKKAFAVQCQLSSERILNLEAEIAHAGENFRQVTEQVNESEREIKSLKIALNELEAINEEYRHQYKESLDIITNLRNSIACAEKDADEYKSQANKKELEVMILKQNLGELGNEKESALLQYKHCLELVSDLENKLLHAEKNVIELNEQSENTETEARHLKEALAKLTEEKEAADLRCHSMLEMNSCLETKFSSAQDEVKKLKLEIETQFAKLQSAEEKCLFLESSNQTLQLKQESLLQKMEAQNEEHSYKQKELGRLWTCIQEERLRLMEKETALQNLQHLHFQSQEDVRSLAAKLQNSTQIAKDMETCNRCLQEEIQKVHEENKNLKELNLSSSLSIKSLNDEISKLKEKTQKLEEDTELQYKQRAIHEQEISCLKEELDCLKKNHGPVQEQVDSTRLNGECNNSSVKMLLDENTKLKEICDQERSEKLVLVEILAVMDKLLERNVLLEDSLSDLNAELDQTREKVKVLEVSCASLNKERSVLITERASLVSPLQIITKSLEELKVNNNNCENIVLGLEGTSLASKSVENTSLLLNDEELDLVTETKNLASQLDLTRQKVEEVVVRYQELERKYLDLEKEKEIMLLEIAKLQDHLDIVKCENSTSATRLAIDRETIDENFRIQLEHFLALQNGMKKVMEMNEELKSEVLERICNGELKNEIGNLNIQISDLQHAFKCLQEENRKVLEEEHSLKTKVLELEEDKCMLQEDNDLILCETLHQGVISSVFQNVIFEQVSKLNELNRSLAKACILNSDLKEKLRLMEENILQLQMTNSQLMELPEKSKNDIKSLRSVVDLLCCDMAHVRDLLCLKEKKFLEAEKKDATETEKKDLMKELDNLKMVYNEIKLAQEDQQKKILELSVDHLYQIKESGFSNEVKWKLETDICNLQDKNRELKLREQSLISLLHVQNTELGQWEMQVASFLDKLILANIHEAFLEEKNREINESCWHLTEMKEAEIKLLKESLNSLVGENDRLTSHLAMYASALVSLRDCVSSLEIRTGMHKANYKIFKNVEMMTPSHVGSQSEAVQKIRSLVPEGFLEMQDIQLRIKAIEEAILETDGPSVKEKPSSSGNLEAAVKRIEQGQMHLEKVQASRQVARRRDKERLGERFSNDLRMHKPTVQVSQTGSELTKDIVLDQDSGCSTYRPRRRGTSEADDRMLELWETTDTSGSIDLKVGKANKVVDVMDTCNKVDFHKEHSTPNSSRELLIVKEVGVDNSEISENSAASRRGRNKRKILDKLASDAQKLTNLQITVKDLKRKVETTEQGRIGRSIQCSNLKDQLEEAEVAIMKSFDANYKLMSSTEDFFMSSNTKCNEESEGCANIRRKISEQVKRESEKIGVLQSEVQKIQFQLLNLDDEKESRGRTRITGKKTRILLKDYLSVRVKNNQKRKKAPCCACVPARRN